jgi:hypothetical protein
MTFVAVPFPNFYQKSYVADHDLNSMINLDDVFSEIFSSLEHNYLEAVDQQEEQPAISFVMGTPNPLQTRTVFVPAVSPPSSDAEIGEWDDLEPTTLAEMRASVRAVSPSTTTSSTDSMQPTPFAANSSANKKNIVKKRSNNPKKRPRPPKEEDEAKVEELQRRERNRQHAKKSRQRKKSFTQDLEGSLTDLKEENKKLRQQIYATIGKTKTESMHKTRLATSPANIQQRFVECLKQPENRVVDADAQKFLSRLRVEQISSSYDDPLGTAS